MNLSRSRTTQRERTPAKIHTTVVPKCAWIPEYRIRLILQQFCWHTLPDFNQFFPGGFPALGNGFLVGGLFKLASSKAAGPLAPGAYAEYVRTTKARERR